MCHSSVGRLSASEKEAGTLKKYLHKALHHSSVQNGLIHILATQHVVAIHLTQGWMASKLS